MSPFRQRSPNASAAQKWHTWTFLWANVVFQKKSKFRLCGGLYVGSEEKNLLVAVNYSDSYVGRRIMNQICWLLVFVWGDSTGCLPQKRTSRSKIIFTGKLDFLGNIEEEILCSRTWCAKTNLFLGHPGTSCQGFLGHPEMSKQHSQAWNKYS